jgi:hypothetical protein
MRGLIFPLAPTNKLCYICEKSISDISHIIQICIFGLNHK